MLSRLKSVDFYAILGVENTASEAELRSAYRRQALRTHPDKGGSAEAFRQVLHAFEVLSSIRARAKYDLLRRQPREDVAPACFPEPKRRKTTGEDRAKASKDVPKTPKAKTLFSKITKSLMRLRRLALAMTSAQRKVALSDLSTELKAMLLDFMTTYGKTGVPTEATTPEGSEGAKDAKVFEELDPTLQCPASSSDETSEDSKEEPAVDHLEHLSDVSTVWVAPKTQGEAPDLSLDAHLSDSSSSAPLALEDADGHAGHATPKKKRAYGCTGMRGVSRRIDSKTSRVSYQASVSFENVIFRSKYRHDIQGALDHHIVLMQIRNEVEQAMLDAPQRSFDEICLSACDARASELKEMNAAYCVDMRAFSIKVGSPSSSCLREVLQDRQRMLQARDAGEQAFCEELVSVMTAERENVYKSRPAVSLERAQEVAQKFMEDVRSKRNLREKRLEMIQKQKEDKETRAQERRQRRLERKTMTLQQRWLCATALAERRLTAMTKRRLKQEKREVRAMRLEDTLALRLREHERKARCREEDQRRQKLRKQLRSPASLKDLTFAQQQELGAMARGARFLREKARGFQVEDGNSTLC
ncbi:unnamed protein product [Cladocopium goreaui]|uniref:J domain-containing protein n=1 Tax=Cladocopium goreaui TaxID=2562237 RepID=A0A9P1BM02_9DINO|nr:unnamed protein product [Cladocopium goreaui]